MISKYPTGEQSKTPEELKAFDATVTGIQSRVSSDVARENNEFEEQITRGVVESWGESDK